MMFRADAEPLSIAAHELVIVRTSVPTIIASDPDTSPIDSWALIASTRTRTMQVGDGDEASVSIHGGRFVFDTESEALLTGSLPALMHVVPGEVSSDRVRMLLALNQSESAAPGPGSEFVVGRLVELLLVELLRSKEGIAQTPRTGLLAGLSDPGLSPGLCTLHSNISKRWTTAKLARVCGKSRSGFSKHFTDVVGLPPMTYLQQWRIAIAKDELRRGTLSVAEIATKVGFRSVSAFGTAFRRALGQSPSRFAASCSPEYTAATAPGRQKPAQRDTRPSVSNMA